jgi:hypothetical protein
MWILIQMRSSIRQVVHSKFKRPNARLHGPNARATYMEIACSYAATVRMTGQHRPNTAQIRKEFQ